MEWKEVAQWLWGLFVLIGGFLLKLMQAKLNSVDQEVDRKVDKTDFATHKKNTREDIIKIHDKVDQNAEKHRAEMNSRFDKLDNKIDQLLRRNG